MNLELTPHLLSTGEIAVHAKIEISSLGASITVGGVSEPTFGQRVIEDDFRLQEGEVNLLGGLIQKTLNRSGPRDSGVWRHSLDFDICFPGKQRGERPGSAGDADAAGYPPS